MILDRDIYRERLGDPNEWTGDWRRPGKYLCGEQQGAVQARMQQHRLMLIGMSIRKQPSGLIAAILCVSRETVDTRRRELGLSIPRGRICWKKPPSPDRLQRTLSLHP